MLGGYIPAGNEDFFGAMTEKNYNTNTSVLSRFTRFFFQIKQI
jgi:hypothetical protein